MRVTAVVWVNCLLKWETAVVEQYHFKLLVHQPHLKLAQF